MNATTSEPVFLDLGATKTYARRRALWFAGVGEAPRLGTLRVIQDRARKSGDSSDVCEYGVEEDAESEPGCRAFILRNDEPDDSDPVRDEFYRVKLGADTAECSCVGTCRGAECKHLAALRALVARGAA